MSIYATDVSQSRLQRQKGLRDLNKLGTRDCIFKNIDVFYEFFDPKACEGDEDETAQVQRIITALQNDYVQV